MTSFISAMVTNSYNFWEADIHFPTQKGSSGFLDMLESSIYIVEMFPNEPMYPSIFQNDLKVLII